MNKVKDRLDAVRKVVNTLEQFDSRDRERILRWAGEELNVGFVQHAYAPLNMVFSASITQLEERKKCWISKIKKANKTAQGISGYLKELNDALLHLKGSKKKKIKIKLRQFKVDDDGPQNEATLAQSTIVELTADELMDVISGIESDQETIRNERQVSTTQFENANQRTEQYLNILASVLKAISEMSSSVIRNIK